jgi:hypothetical protein
MTGEPGYGRYPTGDTSDQLGQWLAWKHDPGDPPGHMFDPGADTDMDAWVDDVIATHHGEEW